MARIPDVELERLKSDISLLRLVEASGIELHRHGKDWLGKCPFHEDKTPSLVITPEKNLWHCLGQCNTGGSVIDWVMRMKGVSFRLAVELLREDATHLAAKEDIAGAPALPVPVKRATAIKLSSELAVDADDQACLERVVAYYHATLKQSPEALQYLEKRGLAHPDLVDTFRLGYANRTLGYRLPEKNRIEGEALRTQLQGVGILRASGHEHFNGSLVIPIFGTKNNIVQVYGRKLLDNLRPGTPKHLYLPRPHQGVFNAPGLAGAKEIILCESLIDALTFWCAGYQNVTTSYGVNGFTDELLAAFTAHPIERVFIAYDRDEAGDKAAEELAPRLMAQGIECLRVAFPHGMDANSYALKVQPAHQSLGVALRGAQWMGKGKASHVVGWRALPSRALKSERIEEPEPVATPSASLLTPMSVEPTPAPHPSLAAEPSVVPITVDAVPESTACADGPALSLPLSDVPLEVRAHELLILLGDRRWRIRGLSSEPTPGQLKINLLVSRGESFHVDTLDLYAARLRGVFLQQAAAELSFSADTLKRDLGAVLLKLEALQAERANTIPLSPALTMTAEDKAAAMALLRDPKLIERIVRDLGACGLVGEDTNKVVAYLACLSRKQEKPLAIVIQSTSAAGKSMLMEAVLALMPSEDRVHYSAMTGQSLFYMGEVGLKHKILAIAEERGVQEAAYALKLLQSQGELTIASTGKDPVSGRLVTHEYKVDGPVMLFLTTTAIEVDEELLNRCLVLTVNESREQTRAIHALQRKRRTLSGLLARADRDGIIHTHQNAQRLLRPLPVVNPYAEQLSFLDATARTRRDHEKYLSLIDVIALLHQYQREIKNTVGPSGLIEYVEVTANDIALANTLAHAVLGHSVDELPPQTRRLLSRVAQLVAARCAAQQVRRSEYRFSRREVREHSGFGHTQLRLHLDRLVDMEYLLVHRGTRGASFVYELLYEGDGADERPLMPGLIEVEALGSATTTETWRGSGAELAGGVRPECGVVAGVPPHTASATKQGTYAPLAGYRSERSSGDQANGASHRSAALSLSSSLAAAS